MSEKATNTLLIDRLNRLSLNRRHIFQGLLLWLGYIMVGYNSFLMTYVNPYLPAAYGISRTTVGIISSLDNVGVFVGSFFGVFSDRLGRKNFLILSGAISGIGMIGCGLAPNWPTLMAFRLFGGFGVGGFIPCGVTYTTETAPATRRGLYVWFSGFQNWVPALTALVFATLGYNYTALFFFGGVVSLIAALVELVFLKESARWLLRMGRNEQAEKIIKYFESGRSTQTDGGSSRLSSTNPLRGVAESWSKDYRGITWWLWVAWFIDWGVLKTYNAWIVAELVTLGHSVTSSLTYQLVSVVFSFPLGPVFSWLNDRVGRKPMMALGSVSWAFALIFMGQIYTNAALLLFSMSLFMTLQPTTAMMVYTAEIYPTRMRGTAYGLTQAVGRFAAIIMIPIVGWMYDTYNNFSYITTLLGVMSLVIIVVVLAFGKETKKKPLEQISK